MKSITKAYEVVFKGEGTKKPTKNEENSEPKEAHEEEGHTEGKILYIVY